MNYKKYKSEDLKEAISKSSSWLKVCIYLNSCKSAGSQCNFKKRADRENIDYSHFPGRGWQKGLYSKKYISAKDYLISNAVIKSHTLKLKLIRDCILKEICNECEIIEWNNKPVVWELDHIDSNHENNDIRNLQILCPNCHSQKTREDRV